MMIHDKFVNLESIRLHSKITIQEIQLTDLGSYIIQSESLVGKSPIVLTL